MNHPIRKIVICSMVFLAFESYGKNFSKLSLKEMISLNPRLFYFLKIYYSPFSSINIAVNNCSHAVQKYMTIASIQF